MAVTLPFVRGRRSGNWERVEAARRQARLALGRDPDTTDLYDAPPTRKAPPPALPEPARVASDRSTAEYVLTLGEAATRLSMSRRELEAMVERGEVAALQGEFIRVIARCEFARLAGIRKT